MANFINGTTTIFSSACQPTSVAHQADDYYHDGDRVENDEYWIEQGLFEDDGNIGSTTTLEWPTLLYTTYDDNKTWRGIIGISKDFNVQNQYSLTFEENAVVHFLNSADLTVNVGATLVIKDNVTIIAKSGIREIIVNGNITIGNNVKFLGEDGTELHLDLNNSTLQLSFNNATFENAEIESDIDDFTTTGSDFTNSELRFPTGDQVSLTNCTFDESSLNASVNDFTGNNVDFTGGGFYGCDGNYTLTNDCNFNDSFAHFPYTSSTSSKVTINNHCTFVNSSIDAIRIFNYDNFEIKNCTIQSSNRNGIYLSNAGGGLYDYEISDCQIILNNVTSYSGIVLYNTTVDILDNYIAGNYYGMKCFNNSNTYIEGDPHGLTQQIINNTSYELFASYGSFPYHVKYNAIVDEDNPQPMVKYLTGTFAHTLDVRYNTWGINFNYLTDLDPPSYYLWQPTWNPPGSKSGEVGEELYFSAKEKIANEDYAGAKSDFMRVVKQDPQSHFAEAALRDIFEIEEYGENDFASLKSYYTENPYVQSTELLIRRGGFFANLCDVKLENWQSAINWYENIIQHPPSGEDSIFAVIDLGYLYLLMEEGGEKSAYSCKMPEHKPKSVLAYNEKTDYLLSLIPGDQLSDALLEDIEEMKSGELLQNIPNPFNSSTQIWYKLNTDVLVSIEVFNTTGKNIQTFNLGNMEAGVNSVEFKPGNLTPGIYFYTIKINGIVTDTKKMTIMK